MHKLQRERRQQLTEKENRLLRTLNALRENSARALQYLGSIGVLHEGLLLTNTDICGELESENPQSVCTRTAISVVSTATNFVQESNEALHAWNAATQQLIESERLAYHANMAAAHAVAHAVEEHTQLEEHAQLLALADDECAAKSMASREPKTLEHTDAHQVCAYCKSKIDLQRAVGFGVCVECAQIAWAC
jgi:hypothetical protein